MLFNVDLVQALLACIYSAPEIKSLFSQQVNLKPVIGFYSI